MGDCGQKSPQPGPKQGRSREKEIISIGVMDIEKKLAYDRKNNILEIGLGEGEN